MAKPGADGTQEEEVIDESQEGQDGTQNEENSEAQDDQAGHEDGSNSNEGSEAGKDGEGGEGSDGDGGENEGQDGEEVDERDQKISELQKQIDELKGVKKDEPEKEPTEAEIAAIEDKVGIPYKAVKYFSGEMRKMAQAIISHMAAAQTESSFESIVTDFAKSDVRFKDAGNYKSGMRQFLNDVRRDLWKDKDVLTKALYYAKGLGADKAVKKVVNSREQNRKIVKQSKPAQGAAAKPAKGGKPAITNEVREMAEAAGMSVEEYLKYKTTPLSEIALK